MAGQAILDRQHPLTRDAADIHAVASKRRHSWCEVAVTRTDGDPLEVACDPTPVQHLIDRSCSVIRLAGHSRAGGCQGDLSHHLRTGAAEPYQVTVTSTRDHSVVDESGCNLAGVGIATTSQTLDVSDVKRPAFGAYCAAVARR